MSVSKVIICEHCQTHPPIANSSLRFIQKSGNTLLEPTPSVKYPEHFQTFLKLVENVETGNIEHFSKPGVGSGIELGSCQLCPNRMFSSKTEKTRHYSLLHSTTKVQVSESASLKHTCTYKDCGLRFQTYHSLRKHKKETNHFLKRNSNAKETVVVPEKRNRLMQTTVSSSFNRDDSVDNLIPHSIDLNDT